MTSCRGINGKEYILENKIGSGGEGTVYALRGNSALVAKIYKSEKFHDMESRKKLERKLKTMIAMGISGKIDGVVRLAWPQDILYFNGWMVGFVMPRIKTKYKIYDIYREGAVREKIYPNYTWKHALVFSYYLAQIVNYLHEYDIVIGDFNQNNIAVDTASNIIILIDCDSFDIKDRVTKEHFPCTVGLQEMLPPELQTAGRLADKKFTKESDNFSLAIHIFRLLMNNADPFGGRLTTNTSMGSVPVQTAVLNGECAYVRRIPGKQIPGWSVTLDILPDELIRLFKKTFLYTRRSMKKRISSRATAKEWRDALYRLCEKDPNPYLKVCQKNRLHIYPAHNKKCPWCNPKETHRKQINLKRWIPAAVTAAVIAAAMLHFSGIVEIPYVDTAVKKIDMQIKEFRENRKNDLKNQNRGGVQGVTEENAWNELPELSQAETSQAVFGSDLSSTQYILPGSDERYITEEELSALSMDEVLLARNEIFARHGRKFMTDWIQVYFENMSWYEGIYEPEAFDAMSDTIFNSYEQANIETIVAYEQKMGYQ